MQRLVLDIVDRFISSQADTHTFNLKMVSIGSPNWRTTALPLLQPVDVKAPGVEAWLLSKENAAVLMGQLRKRTDFRELNSPSLMVHNGQAHTISNLTPKNYVRSIRMRQDVWPGHDMEMGQMQEGYTLQFSPLISVDGNVIDAVIKCQIDQIEKLLPVAVDIPSMAGGTQRVQIQVPQVVSWRLARTVPLAGQSSSACWAAEWWRLPRARRWARWEFPCPRFPGCPCQRPAASTRCCSSKARGKPPKRCSKPTEPSATAIPATTAAIDCAAVRCFRAPGLSFKFHLLPHREMKKNDSPA
jgi:hypothetical protein